MSTPVVRIRCLVAAVVFALAVPTAHVGAAPIGQAAPIQDRLLEVVPAPEPAAGEFVPHAMAIRPDGGFYVLDRDAARVQRFDAGGRFVGAFGGFGTAEGQFIAPTDIALAPDGSLAVLDPSGLSVQRFEADGSWRARIRLPQPSAYGDGKLAVADDGSIWLAIDATRPVLDVFDPDGRLRAQVPLPRTISGRDIAGLALAPGGRAWILNREGGIVLLGLDGKREAEWSTVVEGAFSQPVGLSLAPDGTLWTVERVARRVHQFKSDGTLLSGVEVGSPDEMTVGLADFGRGNDGRLWTAEIGHQANTPFGQRPARIGRVRTWAGDGALVAEWRRDPTNVPQIISSLAPAAGGGVWGADAMNGLRRFDASGRIRATWPISAVYSVADLGDGRILVSDGNSVQTRVFDPSGRLIGPLRDGADAPLPAAVIAPARADAPLYLAIGGRLARYEQATRRLDMLSASGVNKGQNDSIGQIAAFDDDEAVVTDFDLGRLQAFGRDGRSRIFGFDPLAPCAPDVNLRQPYGIVAEPGGTLIVGDTEDSRLRRFRRDGKLAAIWGEPGSGPGQLRRPWAMALDEAGVLWVADQPRPPDRGEIDQIFQHRVQRFGTAPATRWRAEAFADGAMGGEPMAVTHTVAVRLDAAHPLLADPPDGWTARFTRPLALDAGRHRFGIRAAGGVRLWLGDRLALDRWTADAVSETVTLDVHAPATLFARLDHRPAGPDGAAAMLRLDTAAGPIPPGPPTATPPATPTILPTDLPPRTPTPSFVPTRRPPPPNALYLPRVLHRPIDSQPSPEAPDSGGPALPSPAPHLPLGGIDVRRYDIALTLDEMAPSGATIGTPAALRASAVTTVTVALTAGGDRLALNAEPLGMTMRRIDVGGRPVPGWAWVPGRSNAFGLTGTRLIVPLPGRAAAGDVVTATYHYDISLSQDARKGYGMMTTTTGGRRVVQSRNSEYYARFWLPSHDHPSDPATVNVTLNVPAKLVGASNGELVDGTPVDGSPSAPPGRRVFRWRQGVPIQTYLIYVVMGDLQVGADELCYGVVDGQGVVQDCADAQHRLPYRTYWTQTRYSWSAETAARRVAWLSALFGDYPHAKLGIVSAGHPYSMEYTSLLAIASPRSLGHELVHQWWGTDVRIDDWGDFWLKEGITDYFDLYFEEQTNVVFWQLDLRPCHPGRLFQPKHVDGMALLQADGPDRVYYPKAAATIHDLRWRIALAGGLDIWDEPARLAFEGAFRGLYQAYRGRALTAEGLVEHFAVHLGPVMRDAGMAVDDGTASEVGAAWMAAWKARQDR